MGVTWSTPKPISNATKIVIKSMFPKTPILRAQLWNLWKRYKQSLKQDGFSVNCYKRIWYISYFVTVTDTTYVKLDTPDGPVAKYLVEFKQKYAEWHEILEELNSIEHVEEHTDQDQESWYFDMELDQEPDDSDYT